MTEWLKITHSVRMFPDQVCAHPPAKVKIFALKKKKKKRKSHIQERTCIQIYKELSKLNSKGEII